MSQSTKKQTVTAREWVKKGERLYGKDRMAWKFKCPSCGFVQCGHDFEPHFDNPDDILKYLAFSCIGRFDGHGNNEMWGKKQPCNYAGGGLFRINPVTIVDDEGKKYDRFDFADE